MRKFLIALVLTASVSTLLWGCNNKTTKPQGALKATFNDVKVEKYLDLATEQEPSKTVVSQAHRSIQEAVEEYLETAFLDLVLVRTKSYESAVLKYFTQDARVRASERLPILSLGADSKKLNDIVQNKLKIPVMAISYDKNNQPDLGSVRIDFDASYKASFKKVILKFDGWLTLAKEGNDWKIFDYKVEQHLR